VVGGGSGRWRGRRQPGWWRAAAAFRFRVAGVRAAPWPLAIEEEVGGGRRRGREKATAVVDGRRDWLMWRWWRAAAEAAGAGGGSRRRGRAGALGLCDRMKSHRKER